VDIGSFCQCQGRQASVYLTHQLNNKEIIYMYAHYYKSGKKHVLVISNNIAPVGDRLIFNSKKEVNAEVKNRNLKPWNF